MKKDNPPLESLWSRRSGLLSIIVAIIVSAIGFVLDYVLAKEGLSRFGMLIFSNGLTGIFAGGLFYELAREERARGDLVRARMKTIAELNHHIRNALQVIRFLGGQRQQGLDAMQLQLINDSVDRIEWALREVLPRYELNAPAITATEPHVKSAGPAA